MNRKTTIKDKLTRNMMTIVFCIFLIIAICTYIFISKAIKNIAISAGPGLSTIVSRELEGKDLTDLLDKKEESETYKKIDEAMTVLVSKSKGIIDDAALLINTNENKWYYIIDKNKDSQFKLGSEYLDKEKLEEVKKALELNTTQVNNLSTDLEMFIPVKANNGINLAICISIKNSVITKVKYILLGILLIVMIVSLIIVRIIIGGIARKQTKSITVLVNKMKEMSKLEGDLTKRIDIESNDEIGELAQYTNEMLDTIQKILIDVKDVSDRLNADNKEFNNAFNRSAEQFEDTTMLTKNINEKIHNQTLWLGDISSSVNNFNDIVKDVTLSTKEAAAQSINTTNSANEGNEYIKKLEVHSNDISKVVNKTSTLVNSLGNKSEQINGIADTIGAIADQTNLLALNASIEAMHAGEKGKGFAVVAEEVGKLAFESSKSSEEIFNLIQEVRQGINSVEIAMQEVSKKTVEQAEFIENVSDKFKDIVYSINQVSKKVEEVSKASDNMAINLSDIKNQIENLTGVSEENSKSTNKIALNVEEQILSIKQLSNRTKELNNVSKVLMDKLEKLKLS
ncbi:methyl-accepting chemotaxis protein [Clostridium tepidum]|jgi:methyl-accepting chemotaxis protein|uniref:Methyl-accepting chemotaxis protein n=1 Tax=Clostridium tepidum TaxID=1962263 RepID=A0A1S9IBN9_9CLOT|nr:methyl-accepting chemotaxis protein [Clostridium tepidum]MCR1933445.1 methyl-accepting chemotaxis protein [Clostridium tepidum]MDU6878158.1 methyl-accepting chemotaxis protein [Clostridium botulinum]OOO61713.1 methyl-accepting chemotaxis protein [Clostridium tepidum]OOO67675.1 methyl-accepting chemotaxis protein [Clostridium tepidum]